MVLYSCDKCGYSTNHKHNYIKHLNRKNPCFGSNTAKVSNKWLTPENSGLPPENSDLPPENSGKIPYFSQKNKTLIENSGEIICIYCGAEFRRRDNLTRHLKNRCTVLKCHMAQLDTNNKKNQESLHTKIKDLEMALVSKPTYTTNNNNNIIGVQNNIKINNYGCENLDYLTSEKINQLIEAPYTSIPKLIEEVHYHPKHPENHNMKITNKKDPYIKLLDGNTWRLDNRKKVIEGLIEKGKIMLDKYRIEELHSDFKNKCYDQFSEQIEGEDRELIKQMIGDLELLIINKS